MYRKRDAMMKKYEFSLVDMTKTIMTTAYNYNN